MSENKFDVNAVEYETRRVPTKEQREFYKIFYFRHGIPYGSATPEAVMYLEFGKQHYKECQKCREEFEAIDWNVYNKKDPIFSACFSPNYNQLKGE